MTLNAVNVQQRIINLIQIWNVICYLIIIFFSRHIKKVFQKHLLNIVIDEIIKYCILTGSYFVIYNIRLFL